MPVIGVIGYPRSGKTCFLTACGKEALDNNREVMANYNLKYKAKRVDVYEMLSIAYREMEISPKTLLIQEAGKIFDARSSHRKENKLLSSLTGQSGKREIDIVYDDQFITSIDRRLRDVTDLTFISNCVRNPKTNEPLLFEYEMFRGYFLYPMNRKLLFPAQWMSQFYDLYDTREATEPLEQIE